MMGREFSPPIKDWTMSRLFTYSSIADHIIAVMVILLVAMFVLVMFYHPAH